MFALRNDLIQCQSALKYKGINIVYFYISCIDLIFRNVQYGCRITIYLLFGNFSKKMKPKHIDMVYISFLKLISFFQVLSRKKSNPRT